MALGISLHIGVNRYDILAYARYGIPRPSPLPNCIRDAGAMRFIAGKNRFKCCVLTDEYALMNNLFFALKYASRLLYAGDTFLLTFSGHGYHLPDYDGDEEDGKDEAWCMHDGMINDDEIFRYLNMFRPGVKVVVVMDACHSGTAVKQLAKSVKAQKNKIAQKTKSMQANVLLLSACQDEETVSAGINLQYSLFTYQLLRVMKERRPSTYEELHKRISAYMPRDSRPNLFVVGPEANDLLRKRPFSI